MRMPGHGGRPFSGFLRSQSPVRAAALAAAAASAATFLAPAAPAEAATRLSPGRAVEAPQPAGANSPSSAALYGVACVAPGDCAAAGGYQAGNGGGYQPMVAQQTGGRWASGAALRLPADAQPQPDATADGIACPRAGDCVAVGSYAAAGHAMAAFIATQQGGVWGRAVAPAPPPNAAAPSSSELDAVACTSAGACVAVGSYTDVHGDEQAMALSRTPGGSWGRAVEIRAPAGASPDPGTYFNGASCTRAYCVAVGDVNTGSAQIRQALGAVEVHGTWRRATIIGAPANQTPGALAEIRAVSCADHRCVGVGDYVAAGLQHAMSVDVVRGRFTRASEIAALPGRLGPQTRSFLAGVSCLSPSDCVAVGGATMANGATVPLTLDLAAGRWRHARAVRQPANGSSAESDGLYGVSCASSSCTGVGAYGDLAGDWFRADAVTIH